MWRNKETQVLWRLKNKDKLKLRLSVWYQKNKLRIKEKRHRKKIESGYIKKPRQPFSSKDERAIFNREKNRLKLSIIRYNCLAHYSSDPPHCMCCGEKELKFLSLDHINGGGNEHRRNLNKNRSSKGINMAYWLYKNNYPNGFQVLCHNCNMAKGFYGKCPHNDIAT